MKLRIPFMLPSKRIKYLEINLTKEVKKSENYKTLLREIQDLNKWKDICVHRSEDNINTAILPKLIADSMQSLPESRLPFFFFFKKLTRDAWLAQ